MLDVVIGAVLTLTGELVFHDPGISLFGTLLVVVGGLLYVCFRWLGRREAKRETENSTQNPTRDPD